MERGEYIPFRDRFGDICREIAERSVANPENGQELVWVSAEPMSTYSRSVQVAVDHLVACGALTMVEYTKASAWQCDAFRSVRAPGPGRNTFYRVTGIAAIRSWAAERPAVTQRSARRYLSESCKSNRAAA